MTTEVPRRRWEECCRAFSLQHEGWLVRLEKTGAEGETTRLVVDEPLRDVRLEEQGRTLSIVSGGADRQRTVAVEDPDRLWLEHAADGADQGLRVRALSGDTIFVRFRSAARPETVDGLAKGRPPTPGEPR